MSGYSLRQLLEWTYEDRLIDGYTIMPDGHVHIREGGEGRVYDKSDAEAMLRNLIKRLSRDAGEA